MKYNLPAAYPDRSDIIARKAEGRRELATLTFGEKIARMEALRDRLAPIRHARDARSTCANIRA
ncbi:hypothetical protein H0176_01065 [Methylorubrum populi]|nr:hypothetical protein [Methylorubrum populi]